MIIYSELNWNKIDLISKFSKRKSQRSIAVCFVTNNNYLSFIEDFRWIFEKIKAILQAKFIENLPNNWIWLHRNRFTVEQIDYLPLCLLKFQIYYFAYGKMLSKQPMSSSSFSLKLNDTKRFKILFFFRQIYQLQKQIIMILIRWFSTYDIWANIILLVLIYFQLIDLCKH